MKQKLRRAEESVRGLSDELTRRNTEVSTLKAECEGLKAQSKLTQQAGYLKMLKKLEKVGPRSQIQLNLYQSTKQQIKAHG